MEESLNVEVEETMSEEKQPDESIVTNSLKEKQGRKERRNFICGVIEGFYGRPWTTEQRKDLFRKLKKWGMDSYVYAPKDDYKHRAYWRELYTVEEADHLTSLITAAREHDVMFYYALSPGLDMSYSNPKEIQTLKRKLDQVSQFGCAAFALLFDDIDSELSKVDKEAFQTFANAQVSVTNEIFAHLGNPRFLFCPTQYCSTRAIPTVHDSEYLNTLGSKLNHDIDIMWTGNKVISKIISLESIQEITEVLRRPPVIWDNLHANDYDQKRVFLGPYSGRSPELIPYLRGVMTNPNCEFHANTIAIHSLASWSKCSLDSKVNSSISADIKLETENEDGTNEEELPVDCLSKNMYHPRIALKNAIDEWLPEFFLAKEAWGPITKPQPQVTMVMPIIPIMPSINTCMSLTTTTTTSTNTKTMTVPEVNTTQLQALADVCSTVNSSVINPIANPIMNSLVSPTKVVTSDDIVNPIPTCAASNIELPKKIPISIVAVPIMHTKVVEEMLPKNINVEDVKSAPIELGVPTPISVANVNNAEATKAAKVEANTSSTITESTESAAEINNKEEMSIEKIGPLSTELPILDSFNETKAVEITENDNVSINTDKDTVLSIDTSIATPGDTANTPGPLPMVDEHTLSPLSAISASGNEPMECSSSLASQASGKEERKLVSEDVVMAESVEEDDVCNGSMNEFNNSMQVESSEGSPLSNADMKDYEEKDIPGAGSSSRITVEDLYLLSDLFYLPFEHGSRGFKLLNEFNWLKANAGVLLGNEKAVRKGSNADGTISPKPEVAEWMQRAETFSKHCNSVHELLRKIANCANKEICHDLFSYVWDIAGTLTLLNAFVKWLSLAHFPINVQTYTQGTYTWFSKGWKEAFMSGDQEPWVFRGGLIADLQRLMPVDSGNDLFLYKLPDLPTSDYNLLRPYTPIDEAELVQVCTRAYLQLSVYNNDETADECNNLLEELVPSHLRELIADNVVGHFLTLYPQLCIVAHDASNAITGYAAAALNVHTFMRNVELCWIPSMREKYTQSLLDKDKIIDFANGSDCEKRRESATLNAIMIDMIRDFYNYEYQCPIEVSNAYPAVITALALKHALFRDQGLLKRIITVTLATLRSNGCFGVHVRLSTKSSENLHQHYAKIGFTEVYRDPEHKYIYLGRRF